MYLDAVKRHPKEDHALQTLLHEGPEEPFQLVDAPAALAGKGRDELGGVWVVGDEDGVHQHGLCEVAAGLPRPGERVGVAALEDGADSPDGCRR
jgi:hypothetical protein